MASGPFSGSRTMSTPNGHTEYFIHNTSYTILHTKYSEKQINIYIYICYIQCI